MEKPRDHSSSSSPPGLWGWGCHSLVVSTGGKGHRGGKEDGSVLKFCFSLRGTSWSSSLSQLNNATLERHKGFIQRLKALILCL